MRLLFLIFIFISTQAFAGALGNAVGKTKSVFSGDNNTIVNVEKEDRPEEFVPTEDKGYRESEITLLAEFGPYMFPSGSTKRQFSQDTFAIGALWKISDHFQLIGKWLNYEVNSPDGDSSYKATHYMYGAGWRMTTLSDQQVQINVGTASSEVKWIDGGDYEMPVWGEFKYLWCADNTAFGIVTTVFDMPSKKETNDGFKNAGFLSVGITFEVGLPGFGVVQ
jgi:hypothetical protein